MPLDVADLADVEVALLDRDAGPESCSALLAALLVDAFEHPGSKATEGLFSGSGVLGLDALTDTFAHLDAELATLSRNLDSSLDYVRLTPGHHCLLFEFRHGTLIAKVVAFVTRL